MGALFQKKRELPLHVVISNKPAIAIADGRFVVFGFLDFATSVSGVGVLRFWDFLRTRNDVDPEGLVGKPGFEVLRHLVAESRFKVRLSVSHTLDHNKLICIALGFIERMSHFLGLFLTGSDCHIFCRTLA